MRLWLPKVRVHESETRRRNIKLPDPVGITESSWKKEGAATEEEEKTNVQAAGENLRKRARPILKLQEQLI